MFRRKGVIAVLGFAAGLLASVVATGAESGVRQMFFEVEAKSDRWDATLMLDGLPELPNAFYTSTNLVPPSGFAFASRVDPDAENPYANSTAGKQLQIIPITNSTAPLGVRYVGRALVVELYATNAPGVSLYVGIDANNDGIAQPGEEACRVEGGAAKAEPARCLVDLRDVTAKSVWVIAQVSQGNPDTTYNVQVLVAQPTVRTPINSSTGPTATGPGHLPAGAVFPLRLAQTDMSAYGFLLPGKYYGLVLIDGDTSGVLGRSGLVYFTVTRARGGNDVAYPMRRYGYRTFYPRPGESVHRTFFDVPPGASGLHLYTGASPYPGQVNFSVVCAEFPAQSSSADIQLPLPTAESRTSWTLPQGSLTYDERTLSVEGQRCFVNVYNDSRDVDANTEVWFPVSIDGEVQYPSDRPLPDIAPGVYYNPQRSGHGVFLSRSGDQQVLYWYTYLEDGTPTWYVAQDSVPNPVGSVWTASLLRVNWNGTKVNSATAVGTVTLTRVSDSDMMFSWHLDGQAGSERLSRLGAGPCPNFNNMPTNFTGTWYAPAQSGYGMDVLALPDQLFTAFYFYDALGVARWGVGTAQPFAVSNTFNLTQSSGFCPACEYRKVTTQPLGTMTIDYADAGSGSLSAQLTLQPPLSGTWTVDRQMLARLTGSPSACAQ